jgi:hypothetical protein
VATAIAGCAPTRTGATLDAIAPPKPGVARVFVLRDKSFGNIIDTGFQAYLDEAPMGDLKTGTFVYRDVPAGPHKLFFARPLEMFRGSHQEFSAAPGRSYYFRLELNDKGKWIAASSVVAGMADHRSFATRDVELAFGLGRKWRISLDPAQLGLLLHQMILRAGHCRTRRFHLCIRTAVEPPRDSCLVEGGARIGKYLFGVGHRILGFASRGGFRVGRLIVAYALAQGDLHVRRGKSSLSFVIREANQRFSRKHRVVGLDQHFADDADHRRDNLDLPRRWFDPARGDREPTFVFIGVGLRNVCRCLRLCLRRECSKAGGKDSQT